MKNRTSLLTLLLALSLPLGAQDVYTDHPCVDLGLSVKWATYNVGAEAPEQRGDLFAWGETETKETFTQENYRFYAAEKYNGYYSTYDRWVAVKYCDDPNKSFKKFTDGRKILEAVDDAATVQWGESWRMPSVEEWKELQGNCNWFWTTQNGQTGYLVTSLVNGNSIFLPASATKDGNGHYTIYWSADVKSNDSGMGIDLDPAQVTIPPYVLKQFGHPVRAVMDGEKHELVFPAHYNNYSLYYGATGARLSTPPQPEALPVRGTIRKEREAIKLDIGKDGTVGGHDFVDLGLSVRWATTNLGAEKVVDVGETYAWGETQPKKHGVVNNYKMATEVTVWAKAIDGNEYSKKKFVMNAYNDDSIYEKNTDYWTYREAPRVFVRSGYKLVPADDAATAQWGKDWRMPSAQEIAELYTDCMWIAVQQDGLNGFLVQSRVNGNSIFLPFTTVESVYDLSKPMTGRNRKVCNIWSSSLSNKNIDEAVALYVTPESYIRQNPKNGLDVYPRWSAFAIRPVTAATAKSAPKRKAATTAAPTPVHSRVSPTVEKWMNDRARSKKEAEERAMAEEARKAAEEARKAAEEAAAAAKAAEEARAAAEVAAAAEAARAELIARGGPPRGMAEGHQYVDMGLDVCWATCNIGAVDSLDYGAVFGWAETTTRVDPNAADELSRYRNYTLKNAKYHKGKTYTKYKDLTDGGDGIMQLLPEDDAAVQNWGGGWRMPTEAEVVQLIENCDVVIVKAGDKFYAKITSRINGSSLIFPFCDFIWNSEDLVPNKRMDGPAIWISTRGGNINYAKTLNVANYGQKDETHWRAGLTRPTKQRFMCFAIRPVIKVTK